MTYTGIHVGLDATDHNSKLSYLSVSLVLQSAGIIILQAMLVHPDKNGGNDQAEEAFKRLQNAYEVLAVV